MIHNSSALGWFRKHLRIPTTGLLLLTFSLWSVQVKGATFIWDGGTNTWDAGSTANWNGGGFWTNSEENLASFSGVPGVVTLGEAINAGGLSFGTSGYTLAADTLTLAASTGFVAPEVYVAAFGSAAISSTLAGTDGFTKTGDGTLFFSNTAANTYSGDTVIRAGTLVITSEGQLGTSTNTISIAGLANGLGATANPVFTGGQLIVDGTTATGAVTMNREISVSGRGPTSANAVGGLVSIGNNTFNGDINVGGPSSEGRVSSNVGIMTINGDVYLGASAGNGFMGNGNFIVNGRVSGFDTAGDRFFKSGNIVTGTLWLTNSANDFRETLRIDSGTVRVSDNRALGVSTAARAIDFNGGRLEIHTDTPNFDTRNVYQRNNITGLIYATRAFDGSGLNEVVNFGNLTMESGILQFDNRNGYSLVINGQTGAGTTTTWTSGANAGFTNNADGLFTFDGTIRHSENTTRVFTIAGNGDILITGNYEGAGTGAHRLDKRGTGTLTFGGTAGTYTGATNIQQGTISVSSLGALGANSTINIGGTGGTSLPATTVTAALEYTGAGQSSNKVINLAGTTGGAILLGNGTGGLTLTSNLTATGAGIKTLTLGGTYGDDSTFNTIAGVIVDNSGTNKTNVLKIGKGSWVLSGANTYTGTTTVAGGILAVADTFSGTSRDVIQDTSAVQFDVDLFTMSAGGTFAYAGTSGSASTETVGALNSFAGSNTVAALGSGGGSAELTFTSLGTITAGSGINFVNNAGGSVILAGATDTNGILNAHLFYNGIDFASGSAVGAASYTDESAGTILAAGNTTPYLIHTTDITGQTSVTVNAGIKFSDTRNLTMGAAQTLTINNGATTAGGILVTGGSTVTISGGSGLTTGTTTFTGGVTVANSTVITVASTAGLVPGAAITGTNIPSNATVVSISSPTQFVISVAPTTAGSALTFTVSSDLVFRTDSTADILNLSTPVASSTYGWTKLGKGTLVIGAANANPANGGVVSINEGTVRLTTGGKLGADSVDVSLRQGATLDLNGVDLGTAASATGSIDLLNGSGAIINSGTAASLRVGNGNGTSLFTGTISGDIALVKNGTGSFRLQGAQDYAGGVTLNGGNLYVTSLANFGVASGLGTGSATLGNAGSLVFNGGVLLYTGSDGTFYQTETTPSVSIDRLFTLAGSGTIYSQGRFGAANRESVANGETLIFSNPGDVAFSGAGVRTLTLRGDSTGDNEMNLRMTNNTNAGEALSIVKSDAGQWALTNTGNDYTGNTTINGGILRVGEDIFGSRTLPTTSALILGLTTGSGVIQTKGVFDRPVATTATAGSVTWGGSTGGGGFAASTAPLVVNLGGAGATLKWGTGGFVGTGGVQTLFLNSVSSWADVDFQNGIDLNGGTRTIQVDDNGFTGLDFATISGVISNSTGTGALNVTGAGPLILSAANTYNGNTTILSSGPLFVGSIGNATGTTSSSIGASGGDLRFNGNTTQALTYVGSGETATRAINIITALTAARTVRIDSSGTGALILTNINNNKTGDFALTLELRGQNTDANMVTSVLGNGGGTGGLTLTKTDGGVWILNPTAANTFTGAINVSSGTLGVTANGVGSASQINMSNAALMAWDGPLTISTPVQLNNNTAALFTGSNNITLNGNVTKQAGANDQNISNTLDSGAVLTINGNFVNAQNAAATRIINVRGTGSTVWNGLIQDNSATALTRFDIRLGDDASFTLGGNNKAAALGFTGGLVLGQGTLIVGHTGALGPVANIVQLNGGTFTSTVDLTGANAIANPVHLLGNQATISGSQNIEIAGLLVNNGGSRFLLNELDSGKTLTLSGGVSLSESSTGRVLTLRGSGVTAITGVVANGGTGAGSLAYSGLGSLVLETAATATGQLIVNRELVVIRGADGSWNNGTFALNPTGTLRLDNNFDGDNPSGRLSSAGAFAGNGGTLDIIGDSDGSAHNAGALTLNSVQTYITMTDNSGGTAVNKIEFDSVSFPNTGSSLNLMGVATLGTVNRVQFATDPTGNGFINGLMPRTFIGSDFATYDATTDAAGEFGVKAFSDYNVSNSIDGAATTDTMDLTASAPLMIDKTINALKINGSGLSVSGADQTLTLGAAAILNTGGNNSIDVGLVQFGANTGFIQVGAGTSLDVNSTLIGTNGWAKAQTGTISINVPTFITSTTNLLNGTTVLNAGLNTLFPNQIFNVNSGATLDLNGNVQFIERLSDPGVLPGTGGSITTSTGTALLVTNMAASTTVATVISGAVNFARLNGNTLTLESVQTYTGTTTLLGGTLTLQDDASLLGTTSIEIRNATLYLNNNASLQTAVTNRINDATPIALRDGTLRFDGKVQDMTTESLGAVSVYKGANTITVNTGGTGSGAIATAVLTINSLTRNPGTTINFTGTNLGTEGNNAKVIVTNPLTTVGNGILGAWAIGNTTDYAAYNQANGVGWVGSGGFVGYDADFGAGNITNLGMGAATTVTTTLSAGSTTTGLLRFNGGFTNNLEFTNDGDILNLELGGILRSNNNNATAIGTTSVRGVLTSGTSELVVYNAANTAGATQMTINSVISGATSLVKSGAGVLAITAPNTYTLGTTVAQGTLRLEGGLFTTVIPAGGLQINNAVVTMVTNNGQIDATNDVTLTGSSTLTLAGGVGFDNTLNRLIFDNTAGTTNPSVAIPTGSVLNLTSTSPVAVTSNNALTTATISGGTLALASAANTISVGAPNIDGTVYTNIHRSLEISSVISGLGSSINKTGDGLIELSGQSTFTGGISITSGGLVIGANSTGTVANLLVSGPLGRGDVAMAAGTRLFADDSSRSVANAFSFAADPVFSNIGTSTDTLTLNGNMNFATLSTTGLVAIIDTPFLNVVFGGAIVGIGAVTDIGGATGSNTITKSGPGNITGLNITGISSTATINLEGLTNGNTFSLFHDGNGTSSAETINLGTLEFEPVNGANLSLTIGRAGAGYYFPTAAFKTISLTGLTSSVLPNGITLANNNGYGLIIPNNIALAATNNWTVNTANTSLQPAGLTLAGLISGTADLTKSGDGVLVLGNSGNTFTGTINITNGTIEAASDDAFGNAANIIQIGSNNLAEGLRISGDVITNRTINLNAANSGIDVTGSNTLRLDSAFTFATATNALRKNDLGTLVLTQAQTGWDGVLTVGQGVLRLTNSGALGTTTGGLIINNVGASLELPGGITVADAIRIASTNNSSSNGINASGAIHSTGGTNTITGAITIDTTTTDSNSRSGTLTADLDSILNVEGGIVLGLGTGGSNRDNWVGFGGEGTINLTTTGITRTGANGVGTLTKFGAGILNIQVANAIDSQQVVVKSGTLSINGDGSLGASTIGAPGTVYLNPTGVLVLDNSGTAVDNRLGGRNLNISGADLTIVGNSGAATSETAGTFTLREGTSYFTLDADPLQQLNFTTGAVARSAQATLIVRGDSLGDAAGAGVATIKGGNYVFIGQLGDTGTTNKSILPWAYGDTSLTGEGTFFLTADSAASAANTGANILRPLALSEQSTTLALNANVNLTSNETLSTLMTINSLRLAADGGVSLNYVPLTLDSGGMIVLADHTGISGFSGVSYLTTTGNKELDIHTVGNLVLTIPIAGTTGALTKSGPGMLTLAAGNTNHSTVMVNDGTLKLGGGDQTILPGRNMYVNEGGVLDLNGTVQQVNILESRQSAVLARNDTHFGGGTVINSFDAQQATLAMATSSSIFAGSIQGNIAVVRSNAANSTADWNLYVDQSYTGPTLLNGGRTVVNDTASLSGTTSIEISNATLLVTSSNNATEASNLTNRINDAATISLRGGMLQLRSRAALITTETFGAVTLGEGNSIIDFSEGATSINQVDAILISLDRAVGSHATVRFLNIDATPNDDQRLFINTLNGVATTNIGDGLIHDIIGGWATFEREFASYIPGQGIGGLNTQGFAGYSPNVLDEGIATDNIRIVLPNGGLVTTLTGNRTVNSLNIQAPTTSTDDSTLDLGGNTLTLASGGLILSPVATTTLFNNISVNNGNLTAGTTADPADLYLHAQSWLNSQADNTGNADVRIGANIVDNAAGGSVTLVIDASVGKGTLVATNDLFINGSNTYTGGTFVNAGQVRLNNPSADGVTTFAVPGDLMITGGYSSNAGSLFNDRTSTVFLEYNNQISNAATLTIMGGGILNLNGNNQTIANLIFNNHGGTVPQVTTGIGTLTLTGSSITASGQNVSSNATSTIDGKISLSAATTTITVNPVEWNSTVLNPILPNLIINASIEGTNIVKAGTGVLRLSGSNAFTGGVDLQAGGILLGSNNALSTGTLTIGNGTFLSSTADNRIIANAFIVNGDFALKDAFNLTMNGAGSLTVGTHDISVDLAAKLLTLGGAITGAGSINKTGDGILVLGNNSNAYGGFTTVSDGTLRYGAVDAVPTGSALTVLEGALVDITLGGSAVTVGSLAGNSATQGGVIITTATSGTTVFTAGGDNTSTDFGGILTHAAGSTLNFVKTGTGTLTLGGANQYSGSTTVADGRLVAKAVGGSSPLGTGQSLIMGGTTTSGILQLGDSAAPLNLTFTSLASQGTGTLNRFVGGNADRSTLTVEVASGATLFFGNIGGAGTNEANLNFVKQGAGDLSFAGTGVSTFNGTTTVEGGKLFMNTPGAFSSMTTSLTVADGAEFTLRGNTGNTVTSYGFSGSGSVITVGSSAGATLGFGIDGAVGVNQLVLASGQTMNVTGTLTTAVYVNAAPTSGNQYVLINGADANSLHAGGGTFDFNPVVFNGGSFTYALTNETGGGTFDRWVLTPTAVPSAENTWWTGDLTGLAQGVWSATLTTGTGFPSNWATAADGLTDALVPPDGGSNVHFSAAGAANLATTLGASMTIKSLTFHTGNAATTIGSSNGVNTLTLGNGTPATAFLTLETSVGDVGISTIVNLPQDQSWNIVDSGNTLTLSGGLIGTARTLTVNDNPSATGTLLFSGAAATMTGTLAINAGNLVFEDTGSLSSDLNVVLGTGTAAATLKVGNTTEATSAVIGGLSNGAFAGSRVIGGNATTSTFTMGASSGSHTFTGTLGGVGANENNFNLVKAGAGTQILDGAVITYAGTTLVREGTLQLGSAAVFAPTGSLSVIADAGATASMDFNGKNFTTVGVLTLGGGTNGVAQILGTASTLTLGGDIVYDATNDPGGAIISTKLATGARTITVGSSTNAVADLTLNGTVAATGGITLAGAGDGVINGAWTLTGTNLTNTFNSTGTWTINATTNTTGTGDWNINTGTINANVSNALNAVDDIVIDGTGVQGSAIINIGGTAGTSGIHQGDDIFIRNGGQINVSVNNGISTGTDQLVIGDSASGSAAAAGLLNLISADISVGSNGLLLGTTTNIGNITGNGTITTAGSKDLRNGSIDAGITLAGNGQIFKQNTGVVTFSGDRASASTGNTNIREGELMLDYTTNNNSKIGATLLLGLSGVGTDALLTLNGNASAATAESVTATTVLPGNMTLGLNNGTGQTLSLALGVITRSVVGGTLAFQYSSGSSKATSSGPAGTLGYATVKTGAGVERFAAIDGSGDIVQATFVTQNNPALWINGQDIIVDGGITGVPADCASISSLTFTSSTASTLTLPASNHLQISSGGIMVEAGLGAVDMRILGGQLYGSSSAPTGEIIVHQNNAIGSLIIGSNIVNSSGITKTGVGTLVLSGGNSFIPTGSQLNINEGIVQLAGGNALADNAGIFMRTGTTLSVANSSNETVGHLATTAGTVTIALNTSGQLTLNQTAGTTYTGVFTGGNSSVFTLNSLGFNFNVTGATTTLFTGSVVVNSGLLQISGNGRMANAAAFTINKGGNLLLDSNTTQQADRILNTATITLNSADGTFGGQTQPRGLALRTDQDATLDETVGIVTANSGASYVTLEASTANDDADLIMTNLVRANNATLNVRGTNLGSTLAQNNQFRIGNSGNQTAFINALVGGTGAAGSKTISIVPWAIGESYAGATSGTINMGNSLVTYVSGAGFRPLDFATEYSTFATATGATDNVRENLTASLTPLTADTTVNALVINNNNTSASSITVGGDSSGKTLTNTSGAFLFTQNTTAAASSVHSVILGGFDGGVQVGGSEYVFHVVNPSSAANTATLTARIDSPLNTTGASVTKSGRGTLEFTAVNTHGGGTTVNEGTVLIHETANLGSGGLTLAGGTLQLAADFAGAWGTTTLNVLSGGGTLDVLATGAVTVTNLAASGSGDLVVRKAGTGALQLAGTTASTQTGLTTLTVGTLELNKTGANAIGAGGLKVASNAVAATVRNLASNQIADTATVTLINSGTAGAVVWDLNGFNEAIGSLEMTGVSTTNTKVLTGVGVLTVNGNITLNNNRGATGNTGNVVEISGTGAANTGTLDLGGATRTITVESTNTGVNLPGSDANIETVIQNGGIIKEGSRALILSGTNTYTGGTTVNNGEVNLQGSLAAGAVTVGKDFGSLTDAAILSGTGTIAGAVTLGDGACAVGILAPGTNATAPLSNYGAGANGTMTITAVGTALTVANGSQIQLGITNETFNSVGVSDALTLGDYTNALTYIGANDTEFTSSWNVSPAATTDMDFINLTSGSISLGTRSGGAGTGTISIADLGYVATAAKGDVFNLLDWQGVMGGTFDAGSGFSSGGILGDFDLPTIGLGLAWDTSAFSTYGVVVVVPEPTRALLLLLGLFGLVVRRRRSVR